MGVCVSVCFAMGCTDNFWQSFTTKPRDTRSSLRRVSVGLSLAFFMSLVVSYWSKHTTVNKCWGILTVPYN